MPRNILRPDTIRDAQNPPDSSEQGFGPTGTKFVLQVYDYTLGGSCTLHDITGDRPSSSEEDSGLHLTEGMNSDSITLRGWCLSGAAIGLVNMGDSAATISLLLSRTRRVSGTIRIARYRVNWKRGAKYVPISLSGIFEQRIVESSY